MMKVVFDFLVMEAQCKYHWRGLVLRGRKGGKEEAVMDEE